MSSVDKRVVQMQFDNGQFQNGVKSSVKSLDDLKKGLDLRSSETNLTGIAKGVEALSNKFSALGIIGITALQNITNSAIETGKRLVSSLTIDPIKSGFNEYESKVKATRTMMAGTSESIEVVKEALNSLNVYSDKTIYSFADMTANISKFTNAGLKSKESATAIIGISNAAALAGATAEEAARAMYNFGQAMSSGHVKLTDWKSIELANMATIEFKNSLLDAAVSAKKLKKNSKGMYISPKGQEISATKMFNESLEEGWMTTEVLTKVLHDYGDETTAIGKKAFAAAKDVTSGTQLLDIMRESVAGSWTTTWETIIGDADQAKKLWTSVSDIIGPIVAASGEARNKMLSGWKDLGGRTALIEALSNSFKGLLLILKPIKQAFREIFPATTAKELFKITVAFRDLTRGFKMGSDTSNALKNTFKGLFAVIDIGIDGIKFLTKALFMVVKAIFPITDNVVSLTGGIGGLLVSLHDTIEKSGIASFALEKLGFVLGKLGIAFKAVKDLIKRGLVDLEPAISIIKKILSSLVISFEDLFGGSKVYAASLYDTKESFSSAAEGVNIFKKALDGVLWAFGKVGGVLLKVGQGITWLAKTVMKVLSPVFDFVKKKLSEMTMGDIGALITGGSFLLFAKALYKMSKAITNGIASVDKVVNSFTKVLDQTGKALKAFRLKVKAEALLKIAIALAILAGALIALSFINIADLGRSLGILTVVFIELIGSLILINKYVKDIKRVTTQMIALGIGMLLLAFAVKVVSKINPNQLGQGISAIGALMLLIALFVKSTEGGDLKKSSAGMIGFANGILILTASLFILGKLKPETLLQGATAIGALMLTIAAFVIATKEGDLKKSAGGLLGFANGILILTGALVILGKIKPETLEQGVTAIAALMLTIAVFITATKEGDLKKSACGLTAFAIGIAILAGSLLILGKLKPGDLIQGGIAISSLVMLIANFIKVTNGGSLIKSAAGLIGFANGILILTGALVILGRMKFENVVQGVGAIGILILLIANFVRVTNGGDLAKSSAGMMGFAFGLTILVGAVALLAAIDSTKLLQGIGAIVALMLTIALFVDLTKEGDLAKSSAGLIGFSTGLAILAGVICILSALNTEKLLMASGAISALILSIGLFVNLTKDGDLLSSAAALMVFSIGISLLAKSLVSVAKLDYKSIAAAGLAISIVLLAITAFVDLTSAKDLIASAGGLVVFSGAIMVLTLAILLLGSVPIQTLVVGIGALAAMLIVIGLTSAVLAPLAPAIVILAAAILLFGIGCLTVSLAIYTFANALTILSETGTSGMATLITVVQSMVALIPFIMETLAQGIIKFAVTIGEGAPLIGEAFLKILTAILNTIMVATPKILNCIGVLIAAFLQFLIDTVPKMVVAGTQLVIGILTGISNNIGKVIDAAFKVVIAFINGLADAIRNNHNAIYDAVSNLVDAVVGAISDLGGRFVEAGANAVKGFIKGLTSLPGKIWDAGKSLGKSALNAAKKALDEHSPSKEFSEVGMYCAEGLAVGLNRYSCVSEKAATNVGKTAISALSGAVAGISDIINGDMDMQPTIRPVLDLSDVNNGLASTFNNDQAINLADSRSKAETISTMEATRRNIIDKNSNQSITKDFQDMVLQTAKDIAINFSKNDVQPIPNINFNGTYSFSNQNDIDYFMHKSAQLIKRRL